MQDESNTMAHELSYTRWTAPDERVAAKWIDERGRTDRMLAPFGERLLEVAALVSGEHVLDIGCGTGATTVAAWQRVAPAGSVTGIDVSEVMLVAARQRARAQSLPGITWLTADAQVYPFAHHEADIAISRFGVAHFADTAAALKNIYRAIRPGGRFVFTEWSARAENEWMSLVQDVAQRVLRGVVEQPGGTPEHSSEFADETKLRTLLERAGFAIQTVETYRAGLWVGRSPDDVLGWFARLPESRVFEALEHTSRQRLLEALRGELEGRMRVDGVYLAGASRIVEVRV